jgi:hypothetical protein
LAEVSLGDDFTAGAAGAEDAGAGFASSAGAPAFNSDVVASADFPTFDVASVTLASEAVASNGFVVAPVILVSPTVGVSASFRSATISPGTAIMSAFGCCSFCFDTLSIVPVGPSTSAN